MTDDRKLPSAMTMAKNLAVTALDVAQHAINTGGEVMVSKRVAAHRLVRCESCERLEGARCLECGCFIKVKAKLVAAECPLGKWEA